MVAGTLFAIAALVTGNNVGRAESPSLTAEIASPSALVRSGAPITIVWKLRSQSSSLLEGRLELKVKDGHERLARLVTDEIVLNTGEQLYRTVLPTLDTTSPLNSVEVELRFAGARQTIDLGAHSNLRLPSPWQRAFVVAFSDPWQTSLPHDKRTFVESFRLESYNADTTDRTITTSTAHIRPETMPSDPLGYFGFDIVLLVGEGFADLKEPQLQAIRSWVDAGGSLAVVPGREIVRDDHFKFLTELTAGSRANPLTLDSSGRLFSPADSENADGSTGSPHILLRRYGLGRVAVVRDQLDALVPATRPELRRLVAFLWKMRYDQLAEFESSGKWDVRPSSATGVVDASVAGAAVPGVPPQVADEMIAQIRPRDMQLAPLALQTGDQLLARLMPRNLRVVPMAIVAYMLVVYVLAIGPGDYWLLGKFKLRRFTWILFPAVTIGFAVGTVAVSNWYMRVADNRRNVTFLDVGENGHIARRNRFDLLFRATQGEVLTEMQRGLFVAMNHQQFTRGSWFNYQQAVRRGTENQLDLVAIPEYVGRIPARYTVSQYLPQWTPQLNRLCMLAADESQPSIEFDWSSLAGLNASPPNNLLAEENRRRITDGIHLAFGPEASIYAVVGRKLQHIAGQPDVLQRDDPELYAAGTTPYQPNYYGAQNAGQSTFLLDVCSGSSQGGLFNVISQFSPAGGTTFEDLALIDPSDSRQWLLIVIVERGDDLIVYRKLYTGE